MITKRTSFIGLLILIIESFSVAQPFSLLKRISGDENSHAIETFDNGFYVLSSSTSFIKPWGIFVNYPYCKRIDNNFSFQWLMNKSSPPNNYFYYKTVLKDTSGYYLVCGSNCDTINFSTINDYTLIYKYDLNYNEVWKRSYPLDASADFLYDICLLKDGNLILVTHTHLTKITPNSDTLFVKPIQIQISNPVFKIESTADSGFCVFYDSYMSNGIQCVKYNSNGDSITSFNYAFRFVGQLKKSASGEFAFIGDDFSGQRFLVILNASLNIVQTKNLSGNIYTPEFLENYHYAILKSPGFSFVLLDSLLNVVDTFEYAGNDNNLTTDSVMSILYTSDKGIVLTGFIDIFHYQLNTYDTAIIAKLDSNYLKSFILGTDENIHISENKLSIYPNPAQTEFNICGPFHQKLLKLEIFNSIGKKVYTTEILSTSDIFKVPAISFQNGLYFIRVFDADIIYFGKFIKKE